MLKKFFTVFLGSMAAIWLSMVLFVGIILITIVLWIGSMGGPQIKPNSVLYINLAGVVNDRYTPISIQDKIIGYDDRGPAFDEILQSLDRAKTDSRIKGVYLDLRGSSMGMAMREELRQALLDFKKSGKWIYAYSDTYSQGDYYTATVADKMYLNPSGQIDVHGLSATVPFFKNALDKLGVEIQVIKVGTFKSAVEPFILTQMSEPARMQYDVMLGTMWKSYTDNVIADLDMPADSVAMFKRMAAMPMFAYNATELVDAKLVDGTAYRYQVEQEIRTKAGSGDELNLVTPHAYVSSFIGSLLEEAETKTGSESPHIAVVYAVGDIVDSGDGGIVGDKMAPMIVKLADDDNVKGIVLRINSGGGSAFASEQIWSALEYFKSKNKPFYASMGDVAASGGYYIACGADNIYADPSTITGSIGIFRIIPYAKELLNDKLGINFSVVETNPNAVFPRLDAPLTPGQHAALEKSIHAGYDLFVSRVSKGRKMSDADVRKIAEGRVWAGSTAKEIGLVDNMGGLNDAVAAIAAKTGLSKSDIVNYPIAKIDPFDLLFGGQDDENEDALVAAPKSLSADMLKVLGMTASELKNYLDVLARIKSMNVIQAKAEDIIVK